MELVCLTPKGRIALTLKHGKHTYRELRWETGLGDRWLTVKLEELKNEGSVKKSGRYYDLSEGFPASPYELSLYLSFQARRIASELAIPHFVKAIVLFGSVARKIGDQYSDLDIMIVVAGSADKVRNKILSDISRLEPKFHVAIEPLILGKQDFLDNVQSREGGIIYGFAEGYEVLIDKTGRFTEILRERVEEIRRSHEYLEEARIWLKAK